MLSVKHKSEIFKDLEIILINKKLIKDILNLKDKSSKNSHLIKDFLMILNKEIVKDLKNSGVIGRCFLYAGHQGEDKNFSILGDGRQININNYFKKHQKIKYLLKNIDITIKGIGRTPLSKDINVFTEADGYMTIQSAIKSYQNSESLSQLNIQTERVLAILKTNKSIKRYNKDNNLEQSYDGAIIIRISKPLIRLGTLEYLAHNQQYEKIKKILYKIQKIPQNTHYDEVLIKKSFQMIKNNILDNFNKTRLYFYHNMLNTDNISIFGENIDIDLGSLKKSDDSFTDTNLSQDEIDIIFALTCLDSIKNVMLKHYNFDKV